MDQGKKKAVRRWTPERMRAWLIGQIRFIYRKSPDGARREAVGRARIAWGEYRCHLCGLIGGPKEFECDHIIPVIDPATGFTDWNDYISRLFVTADGLQFICSKCHREKTHREELPIRLATRRKGKGKKVDGDA